MTTPFIDPAFKWTDHKLAKLRQYCAENLTISDMGRRIGCGKNAAARMAEKLKIPFRTDPIKAPEPSKPTVVYLKPSSVLEDFGPVDADTMPHHEGRGCRWPTWSPDAKGSGYWSQVCAGVPVECGQPAALLPDGFGGSRPGVYCADHMQRAFPKRVA
jgi:hypothetical protein